MECGLTPAGPLMTDGHANAQQQVLGLRHWAQRGQQGLHLLKRLPVAGTLSATLHMGGDMLHLASAQTAVQVLVKFSLHCIAAVHRASSPRGISYPVRS